MRRTSSPLTKDVVHQPFWGMTAEESLAALQTTPTGLKDAEISHRHELFGVNRIVEKRRTGKGTILLAQVKSPMIVVLIIAGVITAALREYVDASVIFTSVFLNTLLGYWQEDKAETVLAQLGSYVRSRSRVRRNGAEHEIDNVELVPGDVIRVMQGDRIPADARIISVNGLEVDESIVTGESLPVAKEVRTLPMGTALADRKSMVWSGTLVTQGVGEAVICATGCSTEFGRIAELLAKTKPEPTPLQGSVSRFTFLSSAILGALTVILFLVGLAEHLNVYDMFLIAVAVGVSAVPESLPVALTVILAYGVERLAKQKAVVRKLSAAETLGSTTVILTDKTGTLTMAKMALTSQPSDALLECAAYNADVVIENPDEDPAARIIQGRPVEVAVVRAAADRGIHPQNPFTLNTVLDRIPFDSRRKYSVALVRQAEHVTAFLLGAPDILLAASDMSESDRQARLAEIEERAARGERVLGVAKKNVSSLTAWRNGESLSGLSFEGILSFHDPLRPSAKEAIHRIERQGTRTIIVTGDHRGTAEAIARELGMINGRGAIITGEELAALEEHELIGRLPAIRVFARVTPEQKGYIARLYKQIGERVAVIGDGVNDAPALEMADIGVAVGSGTEVAKSAADLVLLDDNIETLASAISEGRRLAQNIRRIVVYLLSDTLDELVLIGGALILGVSVPITALQILFVNLISDSFPAIAFAFERHVDDASREKHGEQIFDVRTKLLILIVGTTSSVSLFILYRLMLSWFTDTSLVKTFVFASFASYTLFVAFSLRSLRLSIWEYAPFGNRVLNICVAIALGLTAFAVYSPFMQQLLGTVALPWNWVVGVVCVGLFNIGLIEAGKWTLRHALP